jgi:hypothetical protein
MARRRPIKGNSNLFDSWSDSRALIRGRSGCIVRQSQRSKNRRPIMQNGNDWYTLPINFSRVDSGKSVAGLRPEITSKLASVQKVFRRCSKIPQYQISIKGGQEWNPKHGLFSLHHTGFAVDIRTRDLPGGGTGTTAKAIRDALQNELGSAYFVLLHLPPDPPHIHVQFSGGLRMSSPGDWNVPQKQSQLNT